MAQSDLSQVKALTFDVFGTVVDWRGSIIRDCTKFGAEHGINVDWGTFADTWRGAYRPSMDRVRRGELPWTNLDSAAPYGAGRAAGEVRDQWLE